MVPYEGASAVEAERHQALLHSLRLGHCAGLLELLRMVSGTRASRVIGKQQAMSKPLENVLLLDAAFEPQQEHTDVAGGIAVAYSCREPGKASENEDTVAIIPFGPDAAVLETRERRGPLLSWFLPRQVEVTASADIRVAPRIEAPFVPVDGSSRRIARRHHHGSSPARRH